LFPELLDRGFRLIGATLNLSKGVKVADLATSAARYCAITGGTYTATGNTGTENEQGTCTFPDGKVCDGWDYFNGKCDRGS